MGEEKKGVNNKSWVLTVIGCVKNNRKFKNRAKPNNGLNKQFQS